MRKFKCYGCGIVTERDEVATYMGSKLLGEQHNFCSMDCYDKIEIIELGLYNPVYHVQQNDETDYRPTPLHFERRN